MEVNGKKVKLQIWDTAGQERFKNITASYYRGGNGVLVVYDITDRESFENLNSWLIEIEKNANKNVYKLLIGNKCDLEDKRKVSFQEGKDFAESNGMKFMETSAKTASKVQEAFELLTNEIIKASISKEKGLEKRRIALEDFERINEDNYKQLKRLEMEDDDFIKYAEYWIKEYKRQGKNIMPLLLELKRYKKNYSLE